MATLDRGPYHNAVYATRRMVGQVQEALDLIGWKLYDIEVQEPED